MPFQGVLAKREQLAAGRSGNDQGMLLHSPKLELVLRRRHLVKKMFRGISITSAVATPSKFTRAMFSQ